MWINAPIPETSTSIIRLNWSSPKARGTVKMPGKSSQRSVAADVSLRANTTHAQMKLTITAAHEIALLKVFRRSVNSTIIVALNSGASSATHGKSEFIILARESREWTRIDQREASDGSVLILMC